MKDTLAKEGKSHTAIHHPLDEFELSDLPFDRSMAVRKREGGLKSRELLLKLTLTFDYR